MYQHNNKKSKRIFNRDLLLPYGVPYFAYVGIASLSQDRLPVEISYVLKIIIVPIFEEYFIRGYIFRVALQWDTVF